MNNVGSPVADKYAFESEYKFSIAFENASYSGYTSEKILEAFAAGTVPIYWGDPDIAKVYNSKAFINLNEGKTLVMCGDFNRSAEDFVILQDDIKHLNTLLRGSSCKLQTCSPWFRADGKFAIESGSYFYDDDWERIDNIMLAGQADFSSFSTVTDSPVADEEGIPAAYKIFTGEGCSDHLPLKCVISL